MLEGDETLWSDAVKGALEVVEAQCQATTQTLQGKLRKAKLLDGVSSRAHAKVAAARASKEKELEESESRSRGSLEPEPDRRRRRSLWSSSTLPDPTRSARSIQLG
jgi:hypothetical protein